MELRPGAGPQQAPSRSSDDSPTDGVWITELGAGAGTAGSRSRTSSTPPASARRTARPSSPTTFPATTRRGGRACSRRPGWSIVGKANLHEFAYGVTSQNLHYGVVPNPSFPGRTAGGSSGGSAAALALGLADGALGTDTGGSIRIPAACCGVVGFKPRFGAGADRRRLPARAGFDHAGPMARDVAGCIELMRTLAPGLSLPAARRARASASPGPTGRRRSCESACSRPRRPSTTWAPVDFPIAEAVGPAFMREVGGRAPRALSPRTRELYGENIRGKIERCLDVDRRRVRRGAAGAERARRARRRGARRIRPAADADAGVRARLRPTSSRPSVRARVRPLHLPVQRARLARAGAARGAGRGRIARFGAGRRAARRRRRSFWRPASRSKPRSRPERRLPKEEEVMKLVLSACALALVAASSAAGSSVPADGAAGPARVRVRRRRGRPPRPHLLRDARLRLGAGTRREQATSCSSRRAGASTRRHSSRPRRRPLRSRRSRFRCRG